MTSEEHRLKFVLRDVVGIRVGTHKRPTELLFERMDIANLIREEVDEGVDVYGIVRFRAGKPKPVANSAPVLERAVGSDLIAAIALMRLDQEDTPQEG